MTLMNAPRLPVRTRRALALAAVTAWLAIPGFVLESQAVVVLTHNNATAFIDPNSQSGLFNWSVDGTNQLNQQWFWYRVGNTDSEHSIDTLAVPVVVVKGTRTVYVGYYTAAFGVEVDYLLTGASTGSGASSIAETITITNATSSALDFHFFEYTDLKLEDVVQLGTNLHGQFNEARHSKTGGGLVETVATPGANHGEAAFSNATLLKLTDANPSTLNDNAGPVGPGDATSALEWDLTIAPGSSAIILIRLAAHL
jgi:hypothetical protein